MPATDPATTSTPAAPGTPDLAILPPGAADGADLEADADEKAAVADQLVDAEAEAGDEPAAEPAPVKKAADNAKAERAARAADRKRIEAELKKIGDPDAEHARVHRAHMAELERIAAARRQLDQDAEANDVALRESNEKRNNDNGRRLRLAAQLEALG